MQQYIFSEERCVMCGEIIPEGRQVCVLCERKIMEDQDTVISIPVQQDCGRRKRKTLWDRIRSFAAVH